MNKKVYDTIAAAVDKALSHYTSNLGYVPKPQVPRPSKDGRWENMAPGLGFARMLIAMAKAGGNTSLAKVWAEQLWGEENPVALALGTSTVAGGGALVPITQSREVIELLRPVNAILKFGPRVIPVSNGNLNLPRVVGGATAAYGMENKPSKASEPTLDEIRMTFKPLRCIVPVSNSLLAAAESAEEFIRDDAIGAINQTMDREFIRGNGSNNNPIGLYHWANPANRFSSSGTSLANVDEDARNAIYRLKKGDVRFINPGWIMSPRTELYLKSLRTGGSGDGLYAFRTEMDQGKWYGYPYVTTNNIPENLGAGSDETEIYLVDFADVVIIEEPNIRIESSSQAAYVDSSGTLQAAFSRDETVLRVIIQHDIAVRHDRSVAVIENVTWGA